MSKEKDEKKTTSSKSNTKSKTKDKEENLKKNNTKNSATKDQKTKKKSEEKEEKKVTPSKEIIEEEVDEDLEDMEESEEVEVKETKKEEKKKPEEIRAKVEKVEKIAKEKKKKINTSKNNSSKLTEIAVLFEKNHVAIYSFIAGLLITTLVAFIIWPDRIATLKDGTQPVVKVNKKTYTANDLYEDMKSYYSVSLLLDKIDNDLLTKMYPENDKMTSEVKSNAEYYFNTYKQYYNYTQEQFLEKNGFSSYDAFLDYLRLDYRRNKYLEDYIKKNLSDDEIKKYYDENVFGDINTQHILVEVKSDSDKDNSKKLSDADAKKLAEEIITKLNDGTSWEQIQKDYKDKVTYELISDKKSADSNLLYKSLISLRKEKNINFSDTDMKSKYESYCKKYK